MRIRPINVDEIAAFSALTSSPEHSATIRADTDVANLPMASAFRRAGYAHFATRREYALRPTV